MDWKPWLAYIMGSMDRELLGRHAYLITENRILRQQITGRVRLSDGERKAPAERGTKLGKKALGEVATIVTPDTILAWYRKFIAKKFDGSKQRKTLGRPRIDAELEALVVRMAQENRYGAMIALLVPWCFSAIPSAKGDTGLDGVLSQFLFETICGMISRCDRGATRGREPMPVRFTGAPFPPASMLTCVRWSGA